MVRLIDDAIVTMTRGPSTPLRPGGLFGPSTLLRASGELDFLQLRARYRVRGRKADRTIDFTASGAAETFRGRYAEAVSLRIDSRYDLTPTSGFA